MVKEVSTVPMLRATALFRKRGLSGYRIKVVVAALSLLHSMPCMPSPLILNMEERVHYTTILYSVLSDEATAPPCSLKQRTGRVRRSDKANASHEAWRPSFLAYISSRPPGEELTYTIAISLLDDHRWHRG